MHITTVHPRDDIRIYHKMVKHLHQDGFDVCLAVADGLGNSKDDCLEILDVGKESNRFLRFLLTPLFFYRIVSQIKPSYLHFHDPDFIIIAYLLSLMGYNVIYDVHEDVPRQILSKPWIPKSTRKYISRFFETLESLLSKRFYAIVTSTEFISERFRKYNDNVFVVKNYPILKEFHTQTNARLDKVICYIGVISEIRGILEVMEALEYLPDHRLFLAGSFESNELRKKVMSMRAWQRVEYLGKLGRSDISNLLSQCSVGIVTLHPTPNYLDSLPIKMFEYMASGLPIVASNFPNWISLVEGNEVGLCADPLNPKDIIEKILSVSNNIALYEGNGIRATKMSYSWEREYKILKRIYE